MIARAFQPPHLAVDAGINQTFCGFRIQQQMVDAKAGIAFPAVSLVIPERVHRRIRMHRADRIDPALIEKAPKQRPRLRLHKRVLGVGLGGINIGVGRHDVEVPREHDRRIQGVKLGRVSQEPLHPGELIFEFRPRLRVAVRRIERGNQHAVDRRLDIAALRISGVAGQLGTRDDGLTIATQDGDAVPRLLPAPNGAITGLFDCRDWKFGICRLQLLKAGNVRPGLAQPAAEIGKPLVDVVDIEGGDLHFRTELFTPARSCHSSGNVAIDESCHLCQSLALNSGLRL